jgi:hydroxymethylpyrimidine pyrophosphatase-like HAD family hydrolase
VAIADEVEAYARDLFGSRIACFKTGSELVELQLPLVNKGEGLKMYCEPHQIDLKDVIAFGDAENDIEMLKIAGMSVCLKDGMDDAKAASDAVTEHICDDDGVGHYLYDHHLI